MAALYQLEIVTPMGRKFEGLVDNCVFRSTEGDVGILKGHSPYVAAIETGEIKIHTENGQTRYAAASEGFVHVSSELVRILVSSCEWAEEIDPDQAKLPVQRWQKPRLLRKRNWRNMCCRRRASAVGLPRSVPTMSPIKSKAFISL